VPSEICTDVARLARGPAREGPDCLTDDALMCGWLQVLVANGRGGDAPRFLQLRSGSLYSYECLGSRKLERTPATTIKQLPIPESASRWMRADVTCMVQILDPSVYKITVPSLLLTASQYKLLVDTFALGTASKTVRYFICFRTDVSGGAPVQVAFRVGLTAVHVFDLTGALEYTLMGLSLKATDEPVSKDYPFGLRISSAASDDMFVPLENLILAAHTPLMILQWMAALQSADLDPPPAQPVPARVLQSGKLAETRGDRTDSGALIGQLMSSAVGTTAGRSFSGLSDLVAEKSNDTQKKELNELMRLLKWDSANPPLLQKVIFEPDFQHALAEFCKTIFTEENVNFCIAVGQFRATRDARAKQALCRQIASEFISYSGKSVVNISSGARKRIDDILQGGVPLPAQLFDAALDEVLGLIETDSWPKFVSKMSEIAEESAFEKGDNSWDSDDSSSYEERTSAQQHRALQNDFGETSEISRPEDLEKIRAEIARVFFFFFFFFLVFFGKKIGVFFFFFFFLTPVTSEGSSHLEASSCKARLSPLVATVCENSFSRRECNVLGACTAFQSDGIGGRKKVCIICLYIHMFKGLYQQKASEDVVL
jgi:hypothetical protein